MITEDKALAELGRLRNRHVAKLLSFIGDTPPYLEQAIKKSFSMFAQDVEQNILKDTSNELSAPVCAEPGEGTAVETAEPSRAKR